MAAITVKNIPEKLYEKLKLSAKSHHRSINNEIIYFLEQSLLSQQRDSETILNKARELRKKTASSKLKDKDLLSMKREGLSDCC